MQKELLIELATLEERLHIDVVYCADVGYRALGNHNETHPYEMRFIYKRSKDEYMALDEPYRDLELKGSQGTYWIGRDLKVFLKQLYEGRVEVFEWLSSPEVYREHAYIQEIRQVMPQYFSLRRSLNTYAMQVMQRGLHYLEMESVAVEYYLMLIPALLRCQWILAHHEMPPFDLELMMSCLQHEDVVIRQAFGKLIGEMQTRQAQQLIVREKALDTYMTEQFKKIAIGLTVLPRDEEQTLEPINQIFRKAFEEDDHTKP